MRNFKYQYIHVYTMSLNSVGLGMLNWRNQLDISRFTGFAKTYIPINSFVLEVSR